MGTRPLWEITARQAIAAGCRPILTSNDCSLLELVEQSGMGMVDVRPDRLCEIDSRIEDTIKYICNKYDGYIGNGPVLLLNPTHPFRNVLEIGQAIEFLVAGISAVVGVWKSYQYTIWEGNHLTATPNRQARAGRYFVTGSIYGYSVDMARSLPCLVPFGAYPIEQNKLAAIDIDTELDYRICKGIYSILSRQDKIAFRMR